ncbi:MAG: hypothetical protein NZ480_06065 [Bdellovibrionaceae bacterium]|nr:hypothetical protein [Pseudobdellovibrionaceae bacterium]MDW8190581.1 glycosyltransferase N-terminal domain-containing protein [Pseudobdellovibrionaceae bacterium]
MIFLYQLVVQPILFVLTHLFWLLLPKKLRDSIKLKWQSLAHIQNVKAFVANNPTNSILIHAASGEIECAKPLISELLQRGYKVLVTHSSPSLKHIFHNKHPRLLVQPLPFDFFFLQKKFLLSNKVSHIFIAKTDLWPNLLLAARSLSIPSYLFAVHLPSYSFSFQLNPLSRWWKSFLFTQFTKIFVVDEQDRQVLTKIFNISPNQIEVVGDTRYDQVAIRIQLERQKNQRLLPPKEQGFRLILGSTWRADEQFWLPILPELLEKGLVKQIIICPHEPTTSCLKDLEQSLASLQITFCRLSQVDTSIDSHKNGYQVILIDRIGILAALYLECDVAFVGGSFEGKVHSVLEPLAAGLPTAVGPYHLNSREAILFSQIPCHNESNFPLVVTPISSKQHAVEWLLSFQKKDILKIKQNIGNIIANKKGATQRLLHQLSFLGEDATTRIPNSIN